MSSPQPSRRFGLRARWVLLLGLLFLLFWGMTRERVRAPAKQVTSPVSEAPRSRPRPTPQAAPRVGAITVRHCGAEAGPVGILRVGDDAVADLSGRSEALELSCELIGPDLCVFPQIPPGRYLLTQGLRRALVSHGAQGESRQSLDDTVSLDCAEACSLRLMVQAEDGCASSGQVELFGAYPSPRAPALSRTWREGEPETLSLPCAWLTTRVSGGECAPALRSFHLDALGFSATVTMSRGARYVLWVEDALSGAPIAGASTPEPDWTFPTRSDAAGRLDLWLRQLPDHAIRVRAEGYADHLIFPERWEGAGDWLTVRLLPMHPFEVLCQLGDAPCPPDTLVRVVGDIGHDSGNNRACQHTEPGRWACEGVASDTVQGRIDGVNSAPVPVGERAEVQIQIEAPERSFCARWSEAGDQVCTLEWREAWPGGARSGSLRITEGEELLLGASATGEVDALIACEGEEMAWSGEVPRGEGCLRVELQPMGAICGPVRTPCRALSLLRRRAVDFEGCSSPLPALEYTVQCEDGWSGAVRVQAGETYEIP